MMFHKFIPIAFILVFWGCTFNSSNSGESAFMNIHLEESWLEYDSIQVVLKDTIGAKVSDTLFHGPLKSTHDLSKAPVTDYHGQVVNIVILGFKGGHVEREVTRVYDGNSQRTVKSDSIEHSPQMGQKLEMQLDRILIYKGGEPVTLTISLFEGWKGKAIIWSSSDSTVASVDKKGVVKGLHAGTTMVHAVFNDTNQDSTLVKVVQDSPILDVGLDTAMLLNTTAIFRVRATQAYGMIESFAWDLDGNGKYDDSSFAFPKEQTVFAAIPKKFQSLGSYTLHFYIRDGEGNESVAERKLTVASQIPVIDSITEKRTVVVGDSASFSARVSVLGGGSLKSWAWDYEGDGTFEDSGTVMTTSAHLSSGHVYRRMGTFQAVLRLTDDAGTSISQAVTVEVRPDPTDSFLASLTLSTGPLSPAFRKDTLVYLSFVPNGQRNVTLFAETESSLATLSVNGRNPVITSQILNLVLLVGTNKIHVKVVAENGQATRTYDINVVVPPNGEEGL
jgi:hypothetical protein